MLKQYGYEAFMDSHRRVLLQTAEANRMINQMRAESSMTTWRPGSLLYRLKLRKVGQHKMYHPSGKGELKLDF